LRKKFGIPLSFVAALVIASVGGAAPSYALGSTDVNVTGIDVLQPVTQTVETVTKPITQSVTPVLGSVDKLTQSVSPVTQVVPSLSPVTADVNANVNLNTSVTGNVNVNLSAGIGLPDAPSASTPDKAVSVAAVPVAAGTSPTGTNRKITSPNRGQTQPSAPVAASDTPATSTPTPAPAGPARPATQPTPGYFSVTPPSASTALPPLEKVTYKDFGRSGIVQSAIRNASTYGFPIGMMMVLTGFVLLNGRIDRGERKLIDAPFKRVPRETVEFAEFS
jgi:hypothetical protein